MMFGRRVLITVAVAGLLAAQAPLRGEWLVGKDGSKFEIKGPWTVKGKVVTFTMPNGTLGSLRLTEIDLDASTRASAAQAAADEAAAAPAPAVKKPPVLVLTDKDVSHEADVAPEAATTPADAAAVAPAGVQISSWDKSYSIEDGGVTVTGTVRNASPNIASQVSVVVKLYDEDGALIASAPASLSSPTVTPNGAAAFRCPFPGVATFAAAKFDISSLPLKAGAPAAAPPDAGSTPPQ